MTHPAPAPLLLIELINTFECSQIDLIDKLNNLDSTFNYILYATSHFSKLSAL